MLISASDIGPPTITERMTPRRSMKKLVGKARRNTALADGPRAIEQDREGEAQLARQRLGIGLAVEVSSIHGQNFEAAGPVVPMNPVESGHLSPCRVRTRMPTG